LKALKMAKYEKIVHHGDPHPDILLPWPRQLLILPIPDILSPPWRQLLSLPIQKLRESCHTFHKPECAGLKTKLMLGPFLIPIGDNTGTSHGHICFEKKSNQSWFRNYSEGVKISKVLL